MDSITISTQAQIEVEDIASSLTENLTIEQLVEFVLLLDNYKEDWDFTYRLITSICNIILQDSKDSLKDRIEVQIVRELEPTDRDREVITESSELIEIVENFLSALKLHHQKHDTGISVQ